MELNYTSIIVGNTPGGVHFSDGLNMEQKQEITSVLEAEARALSLWPARPQGQVIEDRHSQITFAALGVQAPAARKYHWAEENASSRQRLLRRVARLLPEYDVRLSGMTSLDVRQVSSAQNDSFSKLQQQAGISLRNAVYIGSKLSVESIENIISLHHMRLILVESPVDTKYIFEGLTIASSR